jgi:hypothetical protein
MAKKDVIEEILSLSSTFTKDQLESYKLGELEQILKMSKEIAENAKKEAKDKSMISEMTEKNESVHRIKKPNVDKSELVPVMNLTHGSLVYQSRKTGMEVKFEQYGDIEYLEVGELLTMRSSQRRFLDEPWILILDEEVVNYLGLDKLYKKLVNPDNIDEIFNFKQERFIEVIQSAPRGYSQLIVSRAKAKMADGTLDSVAKIKALEERYNVELQN